jgi:FSR family fosmidomycin resistance protein-like MFS transporter
MSNGTNTLASAPKALEPSLTSPQASHPAQTLLWSIVGAAAFAHLLNDLIQAVLPSVYPLLKTKFALTFGQIGSLTLVYQVTASLLQPWIGLHTDKHPRPYLLPFGMVITLLGVGMLSMASSYSMLLVAVSLVGVGSSTFHPEASRIARLASGGRFGTAQSTFQVGGNAGSALGPLLAAAIVMPFGQAAIGWFMLVALLAIVVLMRMTHWHIHHAPAHVTAVGKQKHVALGGKQVVRALTVICVLMFAKFVYIASFSNYFTFYLIQQFGLTAQQSQLYLFVFLAAVAIGTFIGGPVGDRIGRQAVIWVSFLGVAPFALMLPHANLFWTAVLSVAIGLILSSAFAALVVYAQEAVPGRVGMVGGIMFGLMFGISGIGAAALGALADTHGIAWVYRLCSYLPLLGLATAFLPSTRSK